AAILAAEGSARWAVRIVTDSTSDMSPKLARELGVSVVPLSVIFGDESYKEGTEIGHDLFYDKLVRSKVLPTTSAPSPGDFLAAYEPILADGADIVSIHISGKLSATGNNARQAAEQLSDRGGKIEVIDSRSVSLGISFLVCAAAAVAYSTNPQDAEDLCRRLREALPGITVSMTRLGPVIGVHTGPGVLGVGVLEGEE